MWRMEDLEKTAKLYEGKETTMKFEIKESDFDDFIDLIFGGEEDADVKTRKKPIR